MPAPFWGPFPSPTGGQDTAVCGVEEGSLSLKLKAVMLLLEQQIAQGTERVTARGEKSRGRAGG